MEFGHDDRQPLQIHPGKVPAHIHIARRPTLDRLNGSVADRQVPRGWWRAALYARAMPSGFATKAGRSRRFELNPRPDFSGDFYPTSCEIQQERRST